MKQILQQEVGTFSLNFLLFSMIIFTSSPQQIIAHPLCCLLFKYIRTFFFPLCCYFHLNPFNSLLIPILPSLTSPQSFNSFPITQFPKWSAYSKASREEKDCDATGILVKRSLHCIDMLCCCIQLTSLISFPSLLQNFFRVAASQTSLP